MDALKTLKAACEKRGYQSFTSLEVGEYIVSKFTAVTTKHGPRIRIELDDTYMFLPERFSTLLTPEVLLNLNASPKMMIYGGRDTENQNR